MMKVRLPGDDGPPVEPTLDVATSEHERSQPQISVTVECSDCRKEIPRPAAINPEAGDYALYFCGLNCYRQWLTNHEWAQPKSHR